MEVAVVHIFVLPSRLHCSWQPSACTECLKCHIHCIVQCFAATMDSAEAFIHWFSLCQQVSGVQCPVCAGK